MVTVLSVHNSGTRFFLYMLSEVMGVDCQYVHFSPRFQSYLDDLSGVVLHPVREGRPIPDGFEKYLPQDAVRIDIEKTPQRFTQVGALLRRLDMDWTPELEQFVTDWEPIGATDNPDCHRSQLVVSRFLREEHRGGT